MNIRKLQRTRVRVRALIAISAVVVLASTGCSKEQRRDLGEEDVKVVLEGKVEKAVEDKDLAVDGNSSCRADLDAEPKVTASCKGTTESGEAIDGTFDGTADVNDAKCTPNLKVDIGGKEAGYRACPRMARANASRPPAAATMLSVNGSCAPSKKNTWSIFAVFCGHPASCAG
jgi:hypothetical protein